MQTGIREKVADYVSLSRMTTSEATDYEYKITVSGFQLKLIVWGLFYLQMRKTDIAQLDYPKSQWARIREDVISQVDAQGDEITPEPESTNHLDVMSQVKAVADFSE